MLLDLSTSEQVNDLKQLMLEMRAELRDLRKAPVTNEPLMSIEEVAEYTRFERRTVEKWVADGEYGLGGKKIYLHAARYSGRLRFKRADVEQFGLGVGVLTPSVAGEAPQPTKAPAAKSTRKKSAPVDSRQALKVA
ncbi:helix-turn-helix domain-containing protein [Hymenobacter sp. HMF4947]|uniref:Helix-turn-helix domain-containing protein n=1 Tax=Hymenobacter ginkgonis TaxID=2682976 RepID=A0A7K1TES9_9BACT|nr:helix-turn-helix domain-containing protein [Hymenobacter ginkgonis]MVN76913.1 helix-turn-helix domain-containing protein [Hymenobacter ginkgonis]